MTTEESERYDSLKPGQEFCPHCGVPFRPSFEASPVECADVERMGNSIVVGTALATTCTSCEEPIVKIDLSPAQEHKMSADGEHLAYPRVDGLEIAVEIVLEITLQIVLDQTGQEPSEQDREDIRSKLTKEVTNRAGVLRAAAASAKQTGRAFERLLPFASFVQDVIASYK